jgi:hypothetical protein
MTAKLICVILIVDYYSKTTKCFAAANIPNVLHENGRLREVTFREVGEGTNESIDLDKFDQYYHHLFLWDEDAKKSLVHPGLGSEIHPKYGIEGFYSTNALN